MTSKKPGRPFDNERVKERTSVSIGMYKDDLITLRRLSRRHKLNKSEVVRQALGDMDGD